MASSSSSASLAKASTSMRKQVKTMTLKEMMEEYEAKKAGAPAQVNLVPSPVLKYPFFTNGREDLSAKEVFERLVALKYRGKPVFEVGPSLAIPWDRKKTFSFNQMNITHRADQEMWRRMMSFGGVLAEAAKATELLVRTNGSKRAVVTRMCDRMVRAPDKVTLRPPISSVRKILFIDQRRIATHDADNPKDLLVSDRMTADLRIFNQLNPLADVWLPYAFEVSGKQFMLKPGDATHLEQFWWSREILQKDKKNVPLSAKDTMIMSHALSVAAWVHNTVLDLDTQDFLRKQNELREVCPELFTCMLKRKDEKIEREEFHTKVRPYLVYPLPMRLLNMYALAPIEFGLVNYLEDFRSSCAYHMSPFYGSAARHLEFVKHHYDAHRASGRPLSFKGVFYSDDQKWFFFFPDGFVVVAPDIKSMDLSTTSHCLQFAVKWANEECTMYSNVQRNALWLSLMIAFDVNVHVGGPYVLRKRDSVASGVAGTTTIHNVSSAHMHVKIQEVVDRFIRETVVTTVAQFPALLKLVVEAILKIFGFEFKDISFDPDGKYTGKLPFFVYKDYDEYRTRGDPAPFLGQVLVAHEGRHLFIPADISGLTSSLVLPGSYDTPGTKVLERLLGVYITGGWFLKPFREFLVQTFDQLKSGYNQGALVISPDEVFLGSEDVSDLASILTPKELPSYEVMMDFCTLSKEEFFEKFLKSKLTKAHVSEAKVKVEEPESDDVMTLMLRGLSEAAAEVPTFSAAAAGHGVSSSSTDDAAKLARLEAKRRERNARARAALDRRLEGRRERVMARRRAGNERKDEDADAVQRAEEAAARAEEEEEEVAALVRKWLKDSGEAYEDELDQAEDEAEMQKAKDNNLAYFEAVLAGRD